MNNKAKLLALLLVPTLLTACDDGDDHYAGRGGEDGCKAGYERENGRCVPDDDRYQGQRPGPRPGPNPGNPGVTPPTGPRGEIHTAGLYHEVSGDDVVTINRRGGVIYWDDFYENDRNAEAYANVRPTVVESQRYTERMSCRKNEDGRDGYVNDHIYKFEQRGSLEFETNCGDGNDRTVYQMVKSGAQAMSMSMVLTSATGASIEVIDDKIMDEEGDVATLGEDNLLITEGAEQDCQQEYYIADQELVILPSDICETPAFEPGVYKG